MPVEPLVVSNRDALVQIDGLKQVVYMPSRFNAHTTAKDGTLLLYNSFTGHRCGLPSRTASRAARYLSKEGVPGPLDKMGQYLLSKGYIVAEEVDENARYDVLYSYGQYRRDVFQLILLSSEDCNFRCVYCSQEFKRGSMQPWVRNGVKNLVAKRIAGLKTFHVTWFGGEPLLGYDAIEELSPYFQEAAKENEVPFSASMTTNGYLLTPERARKMCDWGLLSYQITIDGTGEMHDAHRPLNGGGTTYDQIMRNVTAMLAFPHEFHIRIRINFDNTNSHLLEPLFATLKSEIGTDPRYSLDFHPVGKWGGPNDDKLDICGANAGAQAQKLRQQARSFDLTPEKLSHQLEPHGDNVCYAARPYNYIIGADGKVMKCTVVLDTMDDNVVGNILESGELRLKEDRLLKWIKPYYHADKMCKKCFFVPVCQGASCPLPRLTVNERPCPPAKTTIAKTLKAIWAEESPEGRKQRLSDETEQAPAKEQSAVEQPA
jgi:uncharacterized protein